MIGRFNVFDVFLIRFLALLSTGLLVLEINLFTGIGGVWIFFIGCVLGALSQVLALWVLRRNAHCWRR